MFTQIVISTLQNDRLNRGYCVLLYVLPIFAPLQPSKITLQPFSLYVVCARTLYIGKTSIRVLFAVCSRFPSYMYVCTIFRFWYVCRRLIWYVSLSRLFINKAWCLQWFTFVPRNLCVKHYASFCIFMQSKNVYLYNIMINRKLWGIFGFSLAPLRKRPIFLLFVFSLFLLSRYFSLKRKQKLKSTIFAVFAVICTFLSQIKRWLSVIYAYIGQTTPHPPHFWHSRVGQLSSENFYFFYFLFL